MPLVVGCGRKTSELPFQPGERAHAGIDAMGLPSQLAVVVLREHRHRPIAGTLLSIGRQTVYLTPEEAVALVRCELGIEPRAHPSSLEIDSQTRGASGQAFITDRAFYSLFSDAQLHCLDVSDYEGADIVVDLCGSVPAHLEGQFDFILDGSCLDNIFDPAAAIRNLARLSRPGGRILHVDRASRRHNVYVAFALSWFHDYYAVNAFADCQVYLAQWDGNPLEARWDFYRYEPVREQDGRITYFGQDRWYYPWREAHAVVIAEKGADSTWARSPVQFEYRPSTKIVEINGRREIAHQTFPADAEDVYVAAGVRFHRSSRASLLRPEEKIVLPPELLHYSPETVYQGSLLPIGDHLARRLPSS
jgi:SAM-dependent methyltransferase